MRLVYLDSGAEVTVGDIVDKGQGELLEVTYFTKPHKPSSSGKVSVVGVNTGHKWEYYVGVIGARWVDREDQP